MKDKRGLLTPRQIEVLELLRDGYTSQEIADILKISANTVKNHATDIRDRLRARNATQAVANAVREGCIDLGEGLKVEVHKGRIVRVQRGSSVEFCDVCGHRVYDFSVHTQTEEHRRSVRRLNGTMRGLGPRR